MSLFEQIATARCEGDPESAFDLARGVLATNSFTLSPVQAGQMRAVSSFNLSTTLNAIAAFSEIRLTISEQRIRAHGFLGNFRKGLIVQATVMAAIPLVTLILLGDDLPGSAVFVPLLIAIVVPSLGLLIGRRRAHRELRNLVRNMASTASR